MLNIACGDRFHEDWINIDFYATSNKVKTTNILNGLPYEDNSIDVVYSSHFIEHLSPDQSNFVFRECHRVLKDGGIIRTVIPDLEDLCKEYLRLLDIVNEDKTYKEEYEWIVIELLDQLVRVNGGGKMAEMFSHIKATKNVKLANYVYHRVGDELLSDIKPKKRKITFQKIKSRILYIYLRLIRLMIPKSLRDLVFTNTPIGEKHQWMYDKFSLSNKLSDVGFKEIKTFSYKTSDIDRFNDYLLDIKKDGTPYKGVSSLYVEARR